MARAYDLGPIRRGVDATRGDDWAIQIFVEGDRTSDDFTAALRPKRGATVIEFTTDIGDYNPGTDSTLVVFTLAKAVTETLDPGDYVWDIEWTADSVTRTLVGATRHGPSILTVLEDVTNT